MPCETWNSARGYVLTPCACAGPASKPAPAQKDGPAEMHVLPVPLTLVTAISTLRITVPPDLRPAQTRKETLDTVKAGSLQGYHASLS